MNWWVTAALAAFLVFFASRGGLPAILSVAKVLAPFVLFYFAVKHITLFLFPDKKEKKSFPKDSERDASDPNVIRICPSCGREENSCLKCKMGFKPRS
ncbi:hypothetical protein [Pseudobacteriovorax antillogorgiicola]|uniref:Uncharacterized protein n=1 Tax=Pseudobacteriovorax antillogorgiicola TaxID=1513793 RepID=A0A1Y6B7W4_9BACT|nr:hypothetical protein [Pseudobacteriovorax antillogorgiicola]TCS58558.1 hypothetical protein EDD56_10271 [Pseudobacteriovorax antillogorgiicola]SME97631.1 hypothetical protein SAMN06296036_102372 [Pseudobacteriovorax antillogorgiicola]